MRVDARNDEEEERKEKKKKKTVSSGKSAKKAKSDDDATMRFLLKLFSDSTNITAGDDENDALSSAKLEGETRSAIFGEGGFAKASLLRFDDDVGSEIPLREEKIRFVRASGKRTPTTRRIDCKRRSKTREEEEEEEENDKNNNRLLFAKHYSANVCVKESYDDGDGGARCWFETTVESLRDENDFDENGSDYVGWARKDVELSEKCGIAEFCDANRGKCSSVRVWNDDWVFRGEDLAFKRKEKSDEAERRGMFEAAEGKENETKDAKGKRTADKAMKSTKKNTITNSLKKKAMADKNYVPLYASDTYRNVFAVGSIVLSTIAFEKRYIEFRYYVDGILYKIDRIKRNARVRDDDENGWWFPVTSHSCASNDVTFNFGTYPMFRNVSEEAQKANEEFLARAKKIYGDNDTEIHDDEGKEEKDLFSCLHAPFTRSRLHIDVSNNSNKSSRSKNEAFVEDELRRDFIRPIKKLMSAISNGECPITNKKDIHILFWQLLRTYFDSTFRMDKFFSSVSSAMASDGHGGVGENDMNVDNDDHFVRGKVFPSPWKVDAEKAKRECFALCRLLVAHDPHVLEYNNYYGGGKEEDEKENALLLSNDEFNVFCEMLKDDGNVVMSSEIYGPRMLDWWFPRCLFECLSFMASRELFCGIEEDLNLPHPLERAAKLLRATEEDGNFRILSHQSWGANFTRLFATRELSGSLVNMTLFADDTTLTIAAGKRTDDDDDDEEEEEWRVQFSEKQKARLNRLKIYTERREQCKAAFVFATMTTSLRNVPERAIVRDKMARRYSEKPGVFEAIKCPIDWEATENITSNDGSTFDVYDYDRSDRMIDQIKGTDRVIDDRAEKKFERNDHFKSDTIKSNTLMFMPVVTGFFRDRTLEELLDYNCTTDMITESHGLNSNKFGTTPLDFWMQETTRWAYDRYEPFAKDPHARLKGTRVGLAASHLVDTLSRLLADEAEAWIEDQYAVNKALFFHYFVANPWHTPKGADLPLTDFGLSSCDAMLKRPKNSPEYWCCPITPLQHYVPGCLKRNRWMRNCDYQRTKREGRAHANIQYDLTNGFDAELLCAAQCVPQFNAVEFWDWNILKQEEEAKDWNEAMFYDYTQQAGKADATAKMITDHRFMTGGTPPVADSSFIEEGGVKITDLKVRNESSRKAANELAKKRQDSLPKETVFTRLRWSPFPCDEIMLDPPTEINAHVRDRYFYFRDKSDPRNELSFREFFKYKAGDSLRQPYKNASEHVAQLLMGMSHLSTFLVEPGQKRPRRQMFLRETETHHHKRREQSNVLRSAYDAIASNNEHTERARVKVAGYCAKLVVSRSKGEIMVPVRPEQEWKKPIVPMALVCFIFNAWRDHFENEKYMFDHECKFAYVLQLYFHSMTFENPGARDVCCKHIELAFKFPLVQKFAFQTPAFATNFSTVFYDAIKSVDAGDRNNCREEELQKQISFLMRVLSNAPEGLEYLASRSMLQKMMSRYLGYLSQDLGDFNKGLTERTATGILLLSPKDVKNFQMLYELVIERLECVARILSRCRGSLESKDFMFEQGLMDQLAVIIAYIGKHFHLLGEEGSQLPFGKFAQHMSTRATYVREDEDDVLEDVNKIMCVDPGKFLTAVAEILCRMTECRLPEDGKRETYYDEETLFLNIRNLSLRRVVQKDEKDYDLNLSRNLAGDGNRRHYKCKVRGDFLDVLVGHVTSKKDVDNLSFYLVQHMPFMQTFYVYMPPAWHMGDTDLLSGGTITKASFHVEGTVESIGMRKHRLQCLRFENRILHAAAVKALRMKLNDLEALEGNKNILPEMLDPITHSIMLDPVFVGGTEKTCCDFSTLSKHFQKSGKRTDPFTGLPVVGEICRNEKLKERIKKFLEKENVMSMIGDVDVDVFVPDDAMSMATALQSANQPNGEDGPQDWRTLWSRSSGI